MNNYILSVIIAVHNVRPHLTKCVNSVLEQSIQSMEIILVDDGSTDGSSELCDELAEVNKCIKVFHKINGGVNTARNAGLDMASGKYITFIDGDDYLKPNTFTPAILFIENDDSIDLVQVPYIYASDGNEKIRERYPQKNVILTRTIDKITALLEPLGLFPGEVWGKIYKRNIWKNLRLREDMQFCEDAYIFPSIMEHCRAIAMIIDGGYCYVLRKGSVTHSEFTPKKRLDCFRFKQIFYETSLKYGIHSGFWWNESCFSAIDAYSYWNGSKDEIKTFLHDLQNTKHRFSKVPTQKKLVKTARLFTPRLVAGVNRFRVQIKTTTNRFYKKLRCEF